MSVYQLLYKHILDNIIALNVYLLYPPSLLPSFPSSWTSATLKQTMPFLNWHPQQLVWCQKYSRYSIIYLKLNANRKTTCKQQTTAKLRVDFGENNEKYTWKWHKKVQNGKKMKTSWRIRKISSGNVSSLSCMSQSRFLHKSYTILYHYQQNCQISSAILFEIKEKQHEHVRSSGIWVCILLQSQSLEAPSQGRNGAGRQMAVHRFRARRRTSECMCVQWVQRWLHLGQSPL